MVCVVVVVVAAVVVETGSTPVLGCWMSSVHIGSTTLIGMLHRLSTIVLHNS